MKSTKLYNFVDSFKCLADKCPDTCCYGWSMVAEEKIRQLYKQTPGLDDIITKEGEHQVLRRDPETDYCVKFKDGLCGIQIKYGESYLSNACRVYPRINRMLDDTIIQSASLSCPEIARLLLTENDPFRLIGKEINYDYTQTKNYLIADLSKSESLYLVDKFVGLFENGRSLNYNIMHFISIARSLNAISLKDWPEAINFYLDEFPFSPIPYQTCNINSYKLIQNFTILLKTTNYKKKPKLLEIMQNIYASMGVNFDPENTDIFIETTKRCEEVKSTWKSAYKNFENYLKRIMQAQLVNNMFPLVVHNGINLLEQAKIITFNFAITRFAFMCMYHLNKELQIDDIVSITYNLHRVLGHMQEQKFIAYIMREAGWNSESEINSLIDDDQMSLINVKDIVE